MNIITTVSKKLSANDLGLTGTHQSGILIPKNSSILGIFPSLDLSMMNPRKEITIKELDSGDTWRFNFIYYNNKLWGGTRDEYRLTYINKYLRYSNAKRGDSLVFHRSDTESLFMELSANEESHTMETGDMHLKVSAGDWRVLSKGVSHAK